MIDCLSACFLAELRKYYWLELENIRTWVTVSKKIQIFAFTYYRLPWQKFILSECSDLYTIKIYTSFIVYIFTFLCHTNEVFITIFIEMTRNK